MTKRYALIELEIEKGYDADEVVYDSTHEFSYLGHVKGKGYLAGDVLKDADAIADAKKIGDKIARLFHTGH